MSKKRVAVVGSGCAGLACAWHLNRCDIDVKCKAFVHFYKSLNFIAYSAEQCSSLPPRLGVTLIQ